MMKRILIIFIFPIFLMGEPMPAPTKEQALQSKWIVIAEYVGYQESSSYKIDYFHGPIAQYKIIRVLKGDALDKLIKVRYDLHDGSACLSPPEWKFTAKQMPPPQSKWILFLEQQREEEIFITYRGDFGRWNATEDNIEKIEKAVDKKD